MKKARKRKGAHKKKQTAEEELPWEQDERFAVIIGYTSGGAPYGLTWEEAEAFGMQEQHEMRDKEIDEEDLPF